MGKYDVEIHLHWYGEVEAETYDEAMAKAQDIADTEAGAGGDWEIDVDRIADL